MRSLLTPFGRPRPAVLGLVAALVGSFASPAGALAASPSSGVHVDPGSPAAKEYQIPLGAARGNGQSGGSSGRQLFGSGITGAGRGGRGSGGASGATGGATANHAKPSAAAAAGSPAAAPRSGAARQGKRSGSLPLTPLPTVASPARAIGTTSSSGAGITWMLAAAVIVLLLGGLGGALLTRRGRRTSPYPG